MKVVSSTLSIAPATSLLSVTLEYWTSLSTTNVAVLWSFLLNGESFTLLVTEASTYKSISPFESSP